MLVKIGHRRPHAVLQDDETGQAVIVPHDLGGDPTVLTIEPRPTKPDPDGSGEMVETTARDAFVDIVDPAGGVMAYNGSAQAVDWVWSDDDGLEALLAAFFGCGRGIPEDVELTHYTDHGGVLFPPGEGPGVDDPADAGFTTALHALGMAVLMAAMPVIQRLAMVHHLKTNAGNDWQSSVMLTTGAQPAAANWVAVTANATAPAAGDTTLTGEITTAGGGLVRAQGTVAHSAGTNTSTVTRTFTANGSDSLPVTLAKAGVFNASSAGSMVWETLISPTAPLNASGDSTTLTWTITT